MNVCDEGICADAHQEVFIVGFYTCQFNPVNPTCLLHQNWISSSLMLNKAKTEMLLVGPVKNMHLFKDA